MAHEAAYLSAMVDTTTKFLDALEKLPIHGDDAGNVAKHHPKYPRGQMYTRMFEAAEAALATYRPMVLTVESTWETGSTWPLTALHAVNSILNETYGITFVYGKNPETGNRETHLLFNNRMLHDRRMAGLVHPSIPETLEPFPQVDPRHIALVRTAIAEMRNSIAEFRTKEAALAETDRIRAEVEAIDAERTRLLYLLREMSSPIFWSIYAERWEEFDRHRTEASECRRTAARMREQGETGPEAEWRRFEEIEVRHAEQLHGIVIEQHANLFVEASNLLEKIAPQVLHKLPIGNLDVLKSQNPVEVAERVREALSFVLAMGREPVAVTTPRIERVAEAPKARDLRPKVYLIGWPDILDALELKNNSEDRSLVRTLNNSEKHPGPIRSSGRGKKPRVEKGKLIEWWNSLEDHFDESSAREANKAATIGGRHPYGRGGTVVPGIAGAIKKRRGGKHPPTS